MIMQKIYGRNVALKKAFTLAEVLITLVIVGVVAALTVPVIIANSNEKALSVALKKNYAVIEQAMLKYYIDNNNSLTQSVLVSDESLKEKFFDKYFNTICSGYECKHDGFISYKAYDNKTKVPSLKFPDSYSVILADGTYIVYNTWNSLGYRFLFVDVNGPYKKPNVIGKDMFVFEIQFSDGSLVPAGATNSHWDMNTYCDPSYSAANSGYACTAKVLNIN